MRGRRAGEVVAERGVPRPSRNCAAKPTVMVGSASELIRFMDWEITFRFGDWEYDFGRKKTRLDSSTG